MFEKQCTSELRESEGFVRIMKQRYWLSLVEYDALTWRYIFRGNDLSSRPVAAISAYTAIYFVSFYLARFFLDDIVLSIAGAFIPFVFIASVLQYFMEKAITNLQKYQKLHLLDSGSALSEEKIEEVKIWGSVFFDPRRGVDGLFKEKRSMWKKQYFDQGAFSRAVLIKRAIFNDQIQAP